MGKKTGRNQQRSTAKKKRRANRLKKRSSVAGGIEGLLHDLRQVGYAAVMAGVFIMVSYSTGVNRPRPTCRRRR